MPALSILMPQGSYTSSCGYCGDPSSTRAEASAAQLSCDVYQKMIDRGWRRAGTDCYKPDMPRTCCPQYPIRLSATEFVPSRSQRQLVNRWNRYVQSGDAVDNVTNATNDFDTKDSHRSSSKTLADAKGSKMPQFSWTSSLHASEQTFIGDSTPSSRHTFEVTLEPSSYTKEKFQLYENYQTNIHHDDVTSKGFKRFLVDSPLIAEPIPYQNQPASHLPQSYGSYHQLYRLDGELIGLAVLDILPSCVSSVYFVYDKTWERFSLGKLSALREAALAREIHDAGATQCKFLYLGYYVQTCQKMRYKGDFKPSELADPETFEWHSLEKCAPILDKHRYGCFTNPEHSLNEPPPPPAPGTSHIDESALEAINAVETTDGPRISVVPLTKSSLWSATGMRQASLEVVEALGLQLAAEIIFLR